MQHVSISYTITFAYRMDISYQVYCNSNYFGETCSLFCEAQNDAVNGYYVCDPHTGEKRCKPG